MLWYRLKYTDAARLLLQAQHERRSPSSAAQVWLEKTYQHTVKLHGVCCPGNRVEICSLWNTKLCCPHFMVNKLCGADLCLRSVAAFSKRCGCSFCDWQLSTNREKWSTKAEVLSLQKLLCSAPKSSCAAVWHSSRFQSVLQPLGFLQQKAVIGALFSTIFLLNCLN